jgi:hypothetical protein
VFVGALPLTHSNRSGTRTEQSRTLFENVRVAFDRPHLLRPDLSRRLRDGVSLGNEVVLLQGRLAATNPHQSRIAAAKGRPPKNASAIHNFM